MAKVHSGKRLPQGRHWIMVGVTLMLFVLVGVFVDLKPEVRENFFFSPKDPNFQQTAKIDKLFPGGSQMIVNVTGPIASAPYLEKIGRLTRDIERLKGVTSASSLTEGPKDLEDAEKSAFWSRLLLLDNRHSSNVVVFVEEDADSEAMIARMEAIEAKLEAKDFHIEMAGAPYIAEMMRRSKCREH